MIYQDISPLLSEKTVVYPGDVPFSRQIHAQLAEGETCTLSSMRTTLHIGAHVDAPSHCQPGAPSIDELELGPFIGRCQVIQVSSTTEQRRLTPESLASQPILASRILFRTDSFLDWQHWHDDFVGLSPALIAFLAAAGVSLVGIDTPSVDPMQEPLLSHQAAGQWGVRLLEGLCLQEVEPGLYYLVALPLAIAEGDGSPVRAILLPSDFNFD